MRSFTLFLPLVAALGLAAPVQAGFTLNPLRITQDSNTEFTVGYNSDARLTDYWCAAGRFVTLQLGLSDRTRVYRLSPPPRKQGQGISFTLDASRSAGTTGLSTLGGPQDGSMSAGGAVASFCFNFDILDD